MALPMNKPQPIVFAKEKKTVTRNLEFISALAYPVIGNSLISMTLLLAMIRAGEVSRVSLFFYLVPPLPALVGWPLLGETMLALAWGGMILAAAGVGLVNRRTT